VILPQKTFDILKKIAFSTAAEGVLSYAMRRGKEAIQVKNHLGILQLPNKTQLEILPKISQNHTEARAVFLRMLRSLPNSPFKSLTAAQMSQNHLPLFEILVIAFLNEVEKITQQGLQKNYIFQHQKTSFLRGKWLIKKQLNTPTPVDFHILQSQFLTDTPPNRLLKTTLLYLQKQSFTIQTQTRLFELLAIFTEVTTATNTANDITQITSLDRRFEHYRTALQWAKVFLRQQSWANIGLAESLPSLLFRSERLFESFVTQQFKKHITDFEVITQDNSKYLIDNHKGRSQFGIRPDIVLKNATKTIVIDIKWKYVSPTINTQHYGIEQADLYQLYAYGQKYNADALYIIYPGHDNFRESLPIFWYTNELPLTILPMNVLANFSLFVNT
jgi:5-methylcytosine-specific restriction enzyme subunit McrC